MHGPRVMPFVMLVVRDKDEYTSSLPQLASMRQPLRQHAWHNWCLARQCIYTLTGMGAAHGTTLSIRQLSEVRGAAFPTVLLHHVSD